MDDNQNEWGDEETLDTKKFRVSYLQDFLAVLQAVTRSAVAQRGRALGKQQNRFPFRARSVLLTSSKSCFPNLLGWQTHPLWLAGFSVAAQLPPRVFFVCFSWCSSPFVLPQFEEQAMLPDSDDQTDHRQWTQQHLDAADLRISSMAPTPPQGEIDADCMDVNVRGPGKADSLPWLIRNPRRLPADGQSQTDLPSSVPNAPVPTLSAPCHSHCSLLCIARLLFCMRETLTNFAFRTISVFDHREGN